MKIVNLGSLNIDKTYSVEHFARPGETIKAKSYLISPLLYPELVRKFTMPERWERMVLSSGRP